MNTEQLEKWIEQNLFSAISGGEIYGVVSVEHVRALFAGKVLVDANNEASCEAALEHELSIMQSAIGSYKSPGEALRALIDWHCAVAVDPQVNGGKVLVPVDALREVIRISDRDHEAWDAVKAAIAASQEPKQ
jgi:hypothetical protein